MHKKINNRKIQNKQKRIIKSSESSKSCSKKQFGGEQIEIKTFNYNFRQMTKTNLNSKLFRNSRARFYECVNYLLKKCY